MQDTSSDGRPNDPPAIPVPTRYAAGEVLDRLGWLPPDLDSWIEIEISNSKLQTPNLKSRNPSRIYVARYPVTNHQYSRFVDAGGYVEEGRRWWSDEGWEWRVKKHPSYRGEDPVTQPEYWDNPRFGKSRQGYPVVGVSWYEANAYCAWLAEGFQVSGFEFQVWRDGELGTLDLDSGALTLRLPAEAEWVAAAGGEGKGRYPWGTKWEEGYANTEEGSIRGTTPVAMYLAGQSPHGVWDMAGNVWEWMAFAKGEYPLRGGSWHFPQEYARVSARFGLNPEYSYYYVGLRVVGSPACSES